jgi:hypothetical protein
MAIPTVVKIEDLAAGIIEEITVAIGGVIEIVIEGIVKNERLSLVQMMSCYQLVGC